MGMTFGIEELIFSVSTEQRRELRKYGCPIDTVAHHSNTFPTLPRSIWSSPSPLTPAGNLYTPNPTTTAPAAAAAEPPLATPTSVNEGTAAASPPGEQGQAASAATESSYWRPRRVSPLVTSFRNFLRLSSSQRNRRRRQGDGRHGDRWDEG